jgi:citrate lyase subunit beta / citryl-CoA lyase
MAPNRNEGEGIRSLLFVPGDSAAMAEKALASKADAIIIDLEDAVAPAAKSEARATVRAVLDGCDRSGKAIFVRINGA